MNTMIIAGIPALLSLGGGLAAVLTKTEQKYDAERILS
jgi:hypothetical protein